MSIETMKHALEYVQEFKSLWWKVPTFAERVNKATREAISFAHNPIFQLEDVLRQAIEQAEKQEPVAWKLLPRNATEEMLKAMDECSTEGYDERLYAGHASSVYMAAWDALPDTTPPQRKERK